MSFIIYPYYMPRVKNTKKKSDVISKANKNSTKSEQDTLLEYFSKLSNEDFEFLKKMLEWKSKFTENDLELLKGIPSQKCNTQDSNEQINGNQTSGSKTSGEMVNENTQDTQQDTELTRFEEIKRIQNKQYQILVVIGYEIDESAPGGKREIYDYGEKVDNEELLKVLLDKKYKGVNVRVIEIDTPIAYKK